MVTSKLRWIGAVFAFALAPLVCIPELSAQDSDGSAGAALGGAILGTYSGSVLGLLGGFGPCNRTLSGVRCTRVAAVLGGSVGLASGLLMGTGDSESLNRHFRSAGYGAAIGGIVGYGLSLGVRQYGWSDVVTFLAVGGGIGASPEGAGVGFGAGALAGVLSWVAIPKFKLGDAVAISLVGLAAGGLAGWVVGAQRAGSGGQPLIIPLQVRF